MTTELGWRDDPRTSVALPAWRGRTGRRRAGITVVDVLVAVVLFIAVTGLLLPYVGINRGSDGRTKCSANLRNIATHAFIYSNQDIRSGGKFPRTYYDPAAGLDRSLTGNVPGGKSFDADHPAAAVGANNVPAAFYLLMKETDLTAEVFLCPYGEANRAYERRDLGDYANWPAPYAAYNSYSYNCPYPTPAAVTGGWKFYNGFGPDFPLASDINPGDTPAGGPTTVRYTDSRKAMRLGNSPNHGFAGQNVVYCDVHVEWQTSPFCGVQRTGVAYRDNLFASTAGGVDEGGKGGTIWAQPQDAADAVMLPTAQDSPGSPIALRTPDTALPPARGSPSSIAPGLAVTAGAIAVMVYLCARLAFGRRRRRPREMHAGSPPHAGV